MFIYIFFILVILFFFIAIIFFKFQERETYLALEKKILLQLSTFHIENIKNFHKELQEGIREQEKNLQHTVQENYKILADQLNRISQNTNNNLKNISLTVEDSLYKGFKKNQNTFINILERTAVLDESQKKLIELSQNIISLKEILSDKRSRGAFGEMQLSMLIKNVLPENVFKLQYTLSNKKRVDCMLFLPKPTGNIAVDSKFPLESYQKISNHNLPEIEKKKFKKQFQRDVKKHILDISEKYIVPGETADSAIMFIPSESIFSEIYSYYPGLIEISHRKKVWISSPTTMMAILTTICSVLKDHSTRKQVHIIQDHLHFLAKDFIRFQNRMDNLQSHIQLINKDIESIYISAKKISSRFEKIDKTEFSHAK